MEHIVRFKAGYDCITFECIHKSERCKPNAGGSHGKHGLEILFIVKGDDGAVQFNLSTGWMPQRVAMSSINYRDVDEWCNRGPMPFDLGYHSKTPTYEGSEPAQKSCEWCDGQPCYYDGSSLNANDAMYALVNGGEDALWKFLDAYYECTFGDAEYPTPAEYGAPLRSRP
jgi:hypothetical protein